MRPDISRYYLAISKRGGFCPRYRDLHRRTAARPQRRRPANLGARRRGLAAV